MAIRLFLPHAQTGKVVLRGPKLHHLRRVLRLGPGDALWVFDGQGLSFPARVHTVREGEAELELGTAQPAPSPRSITVVQGMPKADKLEWVLQKGTELGASAFAPVSTERTVVKVDAQRARHKQERWQRIVEEAARQCGRADVPEVMAPTTLAERASALAGASTLLVLDEEEETRSLAEGYWSIPEEVPIGLVVGPEGGLSRAEVSVLQRLGGIPVTLGRRVLRTETAALVALSVLKWLDGELGQ